MSRGVGGRRGLDPTLLRLWLWLWLWLAAVAPMRPLAWETPYATGMALKGKKKKKKKVKSSLRTAGSIFTGREGRFF